MSLTKHDFGRMLVDKLAATSNVVTLSRWAHQIYLDNSRDLEPGLKDVLLDVGRMEDAVEFEYSAEELLALAETMIDRHE